MDHNRSPWLHQLQRAHHLPPLESDTEASVVVVGGGIAGIMTAYFALRDTDKDIILLEAERIAHGATGHNAGQLVTYFERQLADLVQEFGLRMAADGQQAITSAWDLLDQVYEETKLTTPLYEFTGYAGCVDLEEVLVHLENNRFGRDAGIEIEHLYIAQEWEQSLHIPAIYHGLYSVVPHADILSFLETGDTQYIAALTARKGCMNSALFTEELSAYLLTTYPTRFQVYEHTHVSRIGLGAESARVVTAAGPAVTAQNVILCTNGFEKFDISNTVGEDINTAFHHSVQGAIGYMAAYVDEGKLPPTAISYLPRRSKPSASSRESDPYFYLTRRPFEVAGGTPHNLICIGGPEELLDDTSSYHRGHPHIDGAQELVDGFIHSTFMYAPKGDIEYVYQWHGLMGYTPNGVRRIGAEPKNSVLLYNLGCNGVGILPSIYAGQKISWILQGKPQAPSIFDPLA